MSAKKTGERIYLDAFLKAVGWPRGKEVVEGESPDFIVVLPERTVGVEIVQVFADQHPKRSRMRELESRRGSWLAKLAADYYDAGGRPARVQLQFQPSFFENVGGNIPPELRSRIIQRLLARVRRMKPGAHMSSRIRGRQQSLLATMWIWALPAEFNRYSRWRLANDAVGWARRLLPNHVRDLIAKKALLLPRYHRRVREVVLLIVADKFLVSGMITWERARVSSQGFAAVYLLHFPEGEIDQLA